MSKQSLFSYAYYLSYILSARIQKPQQSRLHRKCCNMCTQSSLLAGPACLFALESDYITFMSACLLICPQTSVPHCHPPRLQWGKKTSVTEPQRQSAEGLMAQHKERTKHPTLSFQFILSSKTDRPVPPELGSFQFL